MLFRLPGIFSAVVVGMVVLVVGMVVLVVGVVVPVLRVAIGMVALSLAVSMPSSSSLLISSIVFLQ